MYSFYRKRWHNIPLRYPGRDYSLPGKYFVTICTGDRRKWFGTIINAEMQLSDLGSIAYKLWYEIPEHFPNITLDEFIIMPDHIHGIIIINRNLKKCDVDSLHDDVGSLHGDVGSLHGDVDSLHGDVDSLHGDVDSLHGDVCSLHATNYLIMPPAKMKQCHLYHPNQGHCLL